MVETDLDVRLPAESLGSARASPGVHDDNTMSSPSVESMNNDTEPIPPDGDRIEGEMEDEEGDQPSDPISQTHHPDTRPEPVQNRDTNLAKELRYDHRDFYIDENGILIRKCKWADITLQEQICIPNSLKNNINV